jgi:hypothetical protein
MKHRPGTWRPIATTTPPTPWGIRLVGYLAILCTAVIVFFVLTLNWWDARNIWPEYACCAGFEVKPTNHRSN